MRSEPEIERTASVPEDLTGRPRRVATGGVSWRKTFSAFQYPNYRLYFSGLAGFSHRQLDDEHRPGLAGLSAHRLQGIVRHRRRRRDRADALLRRPGAAGRRTDFPKRSVLALDPDRDDDSFLCLAGLIWTGVIQPWQIIVVGLLAV